MNITDFFQINYCNYGSYDNFRKIANIIDGCKVSARKCLHIILKDNIKEPFKVQNLCARVSEKTNYIHGATSLYGVIVGMAQDFVGANNYPIFRGNSGGFGTRINPVFAAGRYTRLTLSDISSILFNKNDDANLIEQIFEGDIIEPKYFIPIFPVIFLNGSDGLSTGFSETIYPRNPKEIIKYIKAFLAGKKSNLSLLPWFKGFKGTIRFNKETNSNECLGIVERVNTTKYLIKELPIGTSYQKYIEILDKLVDDKVIVDYEDKCDTKTDEILFEIKTTREFTNKHDNIDSLNKVFRLVKSLPENFCFIDENNSVREFNNVFEILDSYISIRFEFYKKRKTFILNTLKSELEKLVSKYVFCKSIIDKKLVVSNRKKDDIVNDLSKIDKIIRIDGNFDYLLKMPISQITKEEVQKLKDLITSKKDEFNKIKATSESDMWISDLNELEKIF
jgi:DNA topoisomerase-2